MNKLMEVLGNEEIRENKEKLNNGEIVELIVPYSISDWEEALKEVNLIPLGKEEEKEELIQGIFREVYNYFGIEVVIDKYYDFNGVLQQIDIIKKDCFRDYVIDNAIKELKEQYLDKIVKLNIIDEINVSDDSLSVIYSEEELKKDSSLTIVITTDYGYISVDLEWDMIEVNDNWIYDSLIRITEISSNYNENYV